jgi:activator of HSP90 ATPase
VITITKVDTLTGECHINTRKGKIFHFFEFELKLKWKGSLGGEKVEGNLDLPEVSFENNIDEHEIRVNVTKADDKHVVRQLVANQGIPEVRKALAAFLQEFKAMRGYMQEVKEPTPSAAQSSVPGQANSQKVPKTSPAPSPSQKDTPKTEKAGTTTLEFTDRFTAQPSDIYEALMDPRRVEAYTQSSVQMECIEGGKFSLFSGNVTGEYIKLQQNHKIVEKWRLSSWPEGHYSTVTITLTESKRGCDMKLTQIGVPSAEAERTQQAWRENILERIKRMFGFGMGYSPF